MFERNKINAIAKCSPVVDTKLRNCGPVWSVSRLREREQERADFSVLHWTLQCSQICDRRTNFSFSQLDSTIIDKVGSSSSKKNSFPNTILTNIEDNYILVNGWKFITKIYCYYESVFRQWKLQLQCWSFSSSSPTRSAS